MNNIEITEDEAFCIMQSFSDCYSEGLGGDEQVENAIVKKLYALYPSVVMDQDFSHLPCVHQVQH